MSASFLAAGALSAIGGAVSAVTKNPVIVFVVTAAIAFVLIAAGSQAVPGALRGWAPEGLIRAVAAASLLRHFDAITESVVDMRDLVYFLSIMIACLAAHAILIDLKKAD